MNKLIYVVAALACLTAGPLVIAPANAQVSLGLGRDGPSVRVGPDNDRVIDRDREHGRRVGRFNRDDCHEEIVRTHHRDGSDTFRTLRRCD